MTNPRKLLAFCGSTSRPSKTATLIQMIVNRIGSHTETTNTCHDLGGFAEAGFNHSRSALPATAARILDDIESADILVVGSPVYKGSYSGLFKHVFDLVAPEKLLDKPVVLCATGGGYRHALVVEHQLRPLFGFFGAMTVPIAVYASDNDFRNGELTDSGVIDRIEMAATSLAKIVERRQTPLPAPQCPSVSLPA